MNLDATALVWQCWTLADVIAYRRDTASTQQIAQHLLLCDAHFVPTLSSRVHIGAYAEKITHRALRFEAWSDQSLVGLVAAYANDWVGRIAFITSVSVLSDWTGRGVGTQLVRDCVRYAKLIHFCRINLEVGVGQRVAIRLYEGCGFSAGEAHGALLGMHLGLEGESDERA